VQEAGSENQTCLDGVQMLRLGKNTASLLDILYGVSALQRQCMDQGLTSHGNLSVMPSRQGFTVVYPHKK